ncbi:hypothetical protein BRADI_3g30805v3 [Brachypodium distachyon]|uniref:Uncharacterized protein n=1 Tax=Brachypodium distachyon TaxID=15368 RepID=A0A0Q3JGU9_BRADI|nr:hypothetical protein BRADI_3g30805v3 [Brachypodium distachyon]
MTHGVHQSTTHLLFSLLFFREFPSPSSALSPPTEAAIPLRSGEPAQARSPAPAIPPCCTPHDSPRPGARACPWPSRGTRLPQIRRKRHPRRPARPQPAAPRRRPREHRGASVIRPVRSPEPADAHVASASATPSAAAPHRGQPPPLCFYCYHRP